MNSSFNYGAWTWNVMLSLGWRSCCIRAEQWSSDGECCAISGMALMMHSSGKHGAWVGNLRYF